MGLLRLRTKSSQTLRWRGMESNFQFRDAPPTARAPSFGGEWAPRAAETALLVLPRPTTARMIKRRRQSIGPKLEQSLETATCLVIAVGTPITGRPPQSGRIEARTGLRMMPTSPRSPLSFRTAGFPQYGWKDGVSDGAFPTRRSVQACSRHTLATYWFASVLRASRRIHECPAQCRVGYAPMHRRGGWVILLPRGPRSSPGCAVPVCHHLVDPIRPTRRHITTSPQSGLYAMPSLCGSA